jgi:hypothetical protein
VPDGVLPALLVLLEEGEVGLDEGVDLAEGEPLEVAPPPPPPPPAAPPAPAAPAPPLLPGVVAPASPDGTRIVLARLQLPLSGPLPVPASSASGLLVEASRTPPDSSGDSAFRFVAPDNWAKQRTDFQALLFNSSSPSVLPLRAIFQFSIRNFQSSSLVTLTLPIFTYTYSSLLTICDCLHVEYAKDC